MIFLGSPWQERVHESYNRYRFSEILIPELCVATSPISPVTHQGVSQTLRQDHPETW